MIGDTFNFPPSWKEGPGANTKTNQDKGKYANRQTRFKSLEVQRRLPRWIPPQIIDMKRKRNGVEIKSVRPDDVLFP